MRRFKRGRLHDWRVNVLFRLTEKEAQAAHRSAGRTVPLDQAHMDGAIVLCARCEQEFSECHELPCPGRPVVRVPHPDEASTG